jgi:hypothetical protein
MKSVLMIAYWFPPEGNAAVYRPLRFLRHLPAFGWTGRVISTGPPFDRYDPDLLRQLPEGTEVVRVPHGDMWQSFQRRRSDRLRRSDAPPMSTPAAVERRPDAREALRARVRTLVRKAESWRYHPDAQRTWIRPALEATLASCARQQPDVLWATGPPWSSFIVAQRAAERTGIPYVLDFRTSWTIVPSGNEALRPAWAQKRDRRLLRGLLRGAQAVTFFYAAEAECFWRAYEGALDASQVHVIPNGFDGTVEPFAPPPQVDKFTILYTGTLSDYRFDTFLEALAALKKHDSTRAQRMSVQFVGEIEPELVEKITRLNLSGMVSIEPPIPHADVERRQRAAHALLMLERKPTHRGHELLAGAKLFNYLKAGRPILGVIPRGEAERILREVGVSTIADAASVEAIRAVMTTLADASCEGRLSSFVPDATACARYSAPTQTAALARALEALPPLEPFVPGTFDVAPSLRDFLPAPGQV